MIKRLLPLAALGACTQQVHVATLNVRWDNPADGPDRWEHRRDAVAQLLLDLKPTAVALQEVQAVHLRDLTERLPEWRWTWAPTTMVAVGSPETFARTGTVTLPGEPVRGGSIVELDGWTFASLHLGGSPADQDAVAAALLDELQGWPRPWVVAGDFNALPIPKSEWPPELGEGTTLWEQLTAAGFVDGYKALHPGSQLTSGNGFDPGYHTSSLPVDGRLDWILATEEMGWVETEIVYALTPAGRSVSDHWPVRALLER